MFGTIGDIVRNDYPAFDPDVNLGNIRGAGGRTTILFRARASDYSPRFYCAREGIPVQQVARRGGPLQTNASRRHYKRRSLQGTTVGGE